MAATPPSPEDLLFREPTPLGFSVCTTRRYWDLLCRKHPEIADKQAEIRRCLREPQEVRRSRQDPQVYLFYRPYPPYHLAVVVRRLNSEGFIITSYLTDRIKEGERIWPASA